MQVQFRSVRNPAPRLEAGMTIRRDIPLPTASGNRQAYPFPAMKVGDCLVLEPGTRGTALNGSGSCNSVASAHRYAQRHNLTFRSKRDADGTVKIWRLA